MKDIAIYGAGGFGREVACLLRMVNEKQPTWNLIGFFDDGKEKGTRNEYGGILGGIEEVNDWAQPLAVVIAIGSPSIVKRIVESIVNPHIVYPNIMAPDTVFLDENNCSMGKGNLICCGCLFSTNIHIGDFNSFNGLITVGHDTTIANYNSFMPAVRISGEVEIGERNFFGVGSIVLQQKKVGNDVVVGAGSVIIRKTKDGNTYMGNPAIIVKY